MICSTTHRWNTCTGNSRAFADHALWIARHDASSAGTLRAGRPSWTFRQYDTGGTLPGDQNLFHGSLDRLKKLAGGA
ncbi:hypothetical protein AB0D65_30655 [Streptomyces griseoloalbus]|uniref:Uncharacterized protein n=1 Tax=Streptomyces griseoloalbus TaxID=67303 RepID=A0ABV3EDM6_9ACTN